MDMDELNKYGWWKTKVEDLDRLQDLMVGFGERLGNPIASRKSKGVVHPLVPLTKKEAFPNSLSSKFETGRFPLHVDTAYWTTPCRYLILGCVKAGESQRPTNLLDFSTLDFSDAEKELLFNSPFLIQNGRRSFYGSVLSRDRSFVRYDPGCMVPANMNSQKIDHILSSERLENVSHELFWETGMVLVIDNWRVLHGRGVQQKDGRDRELYRVLVS